MQLTFQERCGALLHRQVAQAQRLCVLAQGRAGVRCRVLAHVLRRALGHDQTAAVATLGAQVNQPVAGADHVQVVLNDDERVPGVQELAQCAHELGNVVKVQAGGGLVEQKQRALARQWLARLGLCARGLGQKARQLQALGLAARERGHALAQLQVVQPHVDQRLQGADDLGVIGKQRSGFAHGQCQHIGHVERD